MENIGTVVVGRFQTPRLHNGHRYILDVANAIGDQLLIVLGNNPGWPSKRNPMDFETRKLMLESAYPKAIIVGLLDCSSDEEWSRKLDDLVEKNLAGYQPLLVGSRESFLPYYHGRYKVKEVTSREKMDATQIRDRIAVRPMDSPKFRAGVIYTTAKQSFPTSFQTVDVIIKHTSRRQVIVGRKPGEKKWRFPGGFVDPQDDSLELAAKREVREEAGDIEIDDLKYLKSHRIDDYRYRGSEHAIMTALFSATYIFGPLKAGDDLEEVRWQDIDTLLDCLVSEHKPLAEAYLKQ